MSATTAWLRAEGAAALALAIVLYTLFGGSWWLFAGLFLLPDASMLGYLGGPRVGALAYNVVHTYAAPAIVAGIGLLVGLPTAVHVALIWIAHIGFDRFLGYGLKLPEGFKSTHLGRIGTARVDG